MSEAPFSLQFIEGLISQSLTACDWTEQLAADRGPYMQLHQAENKDATAGYVRYWIAPSGDNLDRMIHLRLIAGPVETQLLFIMGRADSSMPHFHAQAVQFPPAGFVYNVDFIPRLDPVDYPEWFDLVFGPLRRPYKKATSDRDNSCAQAPANPALAVYMSPWGIASSQTDQDELERVTPCIVAYLEQYIALASQNSWSVTDPVAQCERDRRHLERFFADDLDPRAWNGVYRIVGDEAGLAIKALMQTPAK
ncbi:MAG: hypothetical protein GY727_04115 [Gammaproteobacteria bacterium]|nr:hypothetical protein [Gammaproteobacteria bacterium]MCP4091493.1 hypothetical protein [Gammaproteobacteria bacterium]MCP4275403.1 hypothetical protein [Gammaproteobacteria bacterium]MCP4832291.1 hypothetical protein [Gammaproteobacteria bacterium]MCP4928134.1 hypothetical protein [Gammaproteobacteria bacterium]